MKPMSWGLIGPGYIAKTFADAIASSDTGKVMAVASRSAERAEEFAKSHGIPNVYTDYSSLANDPSIDIIYVATPHSFHYKQAKLCIEAGKHVLLEKPSTINAKQIEILTQLAVEKGVLLQEAVWTRFLPCMIQLKQKLADGVIGDIQYITSDIGFVFPVNPDGRMFNSKLGGGALLDLGIYSVAVSQFLLEEYPQIQATGKVHEHGVDVNLLVNMTYPSGRFSQFTTTCVGNARNEMSIVGSNGRVVLPACFWDTTTAEIYNMDNELVETLHVPHPVNGFEYQIEETMKSVRAGESFNEAMPHQASIELMQIMDEIRRQIGLQYDGGIEDI